MTAGAPELHGMRLRERDCCFPRTQERGERPSRIGRCVVLVRSRRLPGTSRDARSSREDALPEHAADPYRLVAGAHTTTDAETVSVGYINGDLGQRLRDGERRFAMKYDLVIRTLAVVLMLSGAVILVVGDGGAIGFALVAVGIALTALLAAEKRRHGPAH
jgi:hypothetical protein